MRHGRRDGPHAQIRNDLRKLGLGVMDLGDVGEGRPDLLVALGNRAVLFEVKDPTKPPSARKLRPKQVAFHETWPGAVDVITSTTEAIAALARRGIWPQRD